MSALEQVTLAGQALLRALRETGVRGLWSPWLALGALQAAILLALVSFAHPLLSWAAAPLVRVVGGEEALHYPGFYRALPLLFGRADLVAGMLVGSVATGWSTRLFADRWRERAQADAWAETAPRALTLILVQLPFHLLALLLTGFLDQVTGGGSGLVRRLGYLLAVGGAVALQAFFLYAPALVVLERRGFWATMVGLPRTWARGFWAALLMGGALLLLLLPLDRLAQSSHVLVGRGSPELVAWLVAARLILGLVASFLLAGGSTLVYLVAVADRSGGGE